MVERERRTQGAGSESDPGGPEEDDVGYGIGFPVSECGDSRGVGCGKDRVSGGKTTGLM